MKTLKKIFIIGYRSDKNKFLLKNEKFNKQTKIYNWDWLDAGYFNLHLSPELIIINPDMIDVISGKIKIEDFLEAENVRKSNKRIVFASVQQSQ